MVDLKGGATGSAVDFADSAEAAELDDATVITLLTSADEESVAELAIWLKAHSRTFAPLVTQAIEQEPGLSPEAAAAVLDAMAWRAQADEETMLTLMEACMGIIARRLTESLGRSAPGAISNRDDALVSSAVAILTANRRARHSERAISSLSDAGPGGALILARAFDAVRGGLKFYTVRRLKTTDVLQLDDNVVASLAHSVSKLTDDLEKPKRDIAIRFLAELGSVESMEPSMIGTTEPLGIGDGVFHASWGAGTVIAANDESVTIDFGSAGTRTLLRALATLRRA
jgi:hypothetical protein